MDPNQHQWGLSRLLSRGVLGGEGWVLVDGLSKLPTSSPILFP